MASTYDIGKLVRVSATYVTVAGATADPTKVYLSYEKPSGTVINCTYSAGTTQITKSGTGDYYKDILTTGHGQYSYRWFSTGTVHTAAESYFSVRDKRVSS